MSANPQEYELATIQDSYVAKKTQELLKHEDFRVRTNEIILDYVESVPFMRKVKEYAGEEFDSRIFKSIRVWGAVIIGWLVTTCISVAVSRLFK